MLLTCLPKVRVIVNFRQMRVVSLSNLCRNLVEIQILKKHKGLSVSPYTARPPTSAVGQGERSRDPQGQDCDSAGGLAEWGV